MSGFGREDGGEEGREGKGKIWGVYFTLPLGKLGGKGWLIELQSHLREFY